MRASPTLHEYTRAEEWFEQICSNVGWYSIKILVLGACPLLYIVFRVPHSSFRSFWLKGKFVLQHDINANTRKDTDPIFYFGRKILDYIKFDF